MSRCNAITLRGERCRIRSGIQHELCIWHDEARRPMADARRAMKGRKLRDLEERVAALEARLEALNA